MRRWTDRLAAANVFFVSVFCAEAVLKLAVLGPTFYFADRWNCFDCAVTAASFVDLFAHNRVSTGLVLALRISRFARIFWVVKKTQQIGKLFRTVLWSLPSLWNVTLLLMVVFYVYAVLGT
jgi:voltage-dependent calcium channel L type alpha-1D